MIQLANYWFIIFCSSYRPTVRAELTDSQIHFLKLDTGSIFILAYCYILIDRMSFSESEIAVNAEFISSKTQPCSI